MTKVEKQWRINSDITDMCMHTHTERERKGGGSKKSIIITKKNFLYRRNQS